MLYEVITRPPSRVPRDSPSESADLRRGTRSCCRPASDPDSTWSRHPVPRARGGDTHRERPARGIASGRSRSEQEMPADPEEIEQAPQEGIQIHYLVTPTSINRIDGQLNVTFTRMELGESDVSGRRRPMPSYNFV